jgi:hypothetical protein
MNVISIPVDCFVAFDPFACGNQFRRLRFFLNMPRNTYILSITTGGLITATAITRNESVNNLRVPAEHAHLMNFLSKTVDSFIMFNAFTCKDIKTNLHLPVKLVS